VPNAICLHSAVGLAETFSVIVRVLCVRGGVNHFSDTVVGIVLASTAGVGGRLSDLSRLVLLKAGVRSASLV